MSQRRRFSLSGFRFLMKPGQFTGGNSERFREQAKGTKFFLRMFGNDLRFLGYLLFEFFDGINSQKATKETEVGVPTAKSLRNRTFQFDGWIGEHTRLARGSLRLATTDFDS